MRLDKVLSHAGHGSRREAGLWIREGRVTVDGEAVRRPEASVEPLRQCVLLNGQDIGFAEHYYVMMHKPEDFVSSTDDPRERPVTELLDGRYRNMGLFPAGRLDKDATGLLLLTTDGALAHRLLSPSRHVDKEYLVTLEGTLAPNAVERFARGVELADGTVCRPAELSMLESGGARIVLREGKYHQIKRMVAACGAHVTSIHRVRMGTLCLDDELPCGQWRPLTPLELEKIRQF